MLSFTRHANVIANGKKNCFRESYFCTFFFADNYRFVVMKNNEEIPHRGKSIFNKYNQEVLSALSHHQRYQISIKLFAISANYLQC